jgi:hypothetical protein
MPPGQLVLVLLTRLFDSDQLGSFPSEQLGNPLLLISWGRFLPNSWGYPLLLIGWDLISWDVMLVISFGIFPDQLDNRALISRVPSLLISWCQLLRVSWDPLLLIGWGACS